MLINTRPAFISYIEVCHKTSCDDTIGQETNNRSTHGIVPASASLTAACTTSLMRSKKITAGLEHRQSPRTLNCSVPTHELAGWDMIIHTPTRSQGRLIPNSSTSPARLHSNHVGWLATVDSLKLVGLFLSCVRICQTPMGTHDIPDM